MNRTVDDLHTQHSVDQSLDDITDRVNDTNNNNNNNNNDDTYKKQKWLKEATATGQGFYNNN